jgi:hypothetical protein
MNGSTATAAMRSQAIVRRRRLCTTAASAVKVMPTHRPGSQISAANTTIRTSGIADQPCSCRKSHPCRSRGMLVLVKDAAEAVLSSYVEVGQFCLGRRSVWVTGASGGRSRCACRTGRSPNMPDTAAAAPYIEEGAAGRE